MKNSSFIITLVAAVGSGLMLGMVAFNATEPKAATPPAPVTANSEAPAAAPSPSSTAPAPSDADIPQPPQEASDDTFGAPPVDSTPAAPGLPGSANPVVLD